MASFVRLSEHGVVERFPLRVGAVIGRAEGCAIRIRAACVSRHHARIGYGYGYSIVVGLRAEPICGWFIEDLRSENGTFVDALPIRRMGLRDGVVVCVGTVSLTLVHALAPARSRAQA